MKIWIEWLGREWIGPKWFSRGKRYFTRFTRDGGELVDSGLRFNIYRLHVTLWTKTELVAVHKPLWSEND
jgi:hypothetical protein